MLSSIVSGVASAVLGLLLKIAEIIGVYRAGEKAQADRDRDATLDALIRERDAQGRAPSTPEELAKNAEEGKL